MAQTPQQPTPIFRAAIAAATSLSFVAGALWLRGQEAPPPVFAATKAERCEAYQTAIEKLQSLRNLVENAQTLEEIEAYGRVFLSIDRELQDVLGEGITKDEETATSSPHLVPPLPEDSAAPPSSDIPSQADAPSPSAWTPNITQELPPARREVVMRNDRELRAAVARAQPGDHIILENGTYKKTLIINKKGTAEAPIVIRARTILGAHLQGGLRLAESSRNIWIYGVDLKDSYSVVSGENHVLRRVRIWPAFRNGGDSVGVEFVRGKNARVDYCELRLYTTQEAEQLFGKVWRNPSSVGAIRSVFKSERDWFDNLTIERCLLTGGASGLPYSAPNSQFIEAQGPAGNKNRLRFTHKINWVMRYLYGNVPRDRTIIDMKQAGMHLEDSHIISAGGAIQVRDGCCHTIRRSRFENTTVEVVGPYHILENVVGSIRLLAGNKPWDAWDAQGGPHLQAYQVLVRNTKGVLRIGHQYSLQHTFPALATQVEGHDGPISYGLHENTKVSETASVPAEEPPRLSERDVGPFAPWQGVAP